MKKNDLKNALNERLQYTEWTQEDTWSVLRKIRGSKKTFNRRLITMVSWAAALVLIVGLGVGVFVTRPGAPDQITVSYTPTPVEMTALTGGEGAGTGDLPGEAGGKAAGSAEDVCRQLDERYPGLRDQLKPLNLSCESQGIRMDVIAGLVGKQDAWFIYSLQDLEDRYSGYEYYYGFRPDYSLGKNDYTADSILLEDKAARRITGLAHTIYSSETDTALDSFTAGISDISVQRTAVVDLVPYVKQYADTAKATDAPALLRIDEDSRPQGLQVLDYTHPLDIRLVEDDPIFKNILLTGIGWIGDELHVQFHNTDSRLITGENEYSSDSWFIEINSSPADICSVIYGSAYNPRMWDENGDGCKDWADYALDCTPAGIESAELTASFEVIRDVLDTGWNVEIPLSAVQADEDAPADIDPRQYDRAWRNEQLLADDPSQIFIEIPEDETLLVDNIRYCLLEDQAIVIGPKAPIPESAELVIPETVQGHTVTVIREGAFENIRKLTAVTLPDTVRSIRPRAFEGCTNLKTINIPENVTCIGYTAFSGCRSLEDIQLPAGLRTIGEGAFSGCQSLETIQLPAKLRILGANAFRNCTSLAAVTLPGSLEQLESDIFFGCTGLMNAEIQEGISFIGLRAFSGCTSLSNLLLPYSLNAVGDEAFSGCAGLASLSLPEAVQSIGSRAFANCGNLENVYLPKDISAIDPYAFAGCENLQCIVCDASYAQTYCMENSIPYTLNGQGGRVNSTRPSVSMELDKTRLAEGETVSVTITVTSDSDGTMPSPVTLYDPAGHLIEGFGSPVLKAHESKQWTGTWTVTPEQLKAQKITYFIRYSAYDGVTNPETGEPELRSHKVNFSKKIIQAPEATPAPGLPETPEQTAAPADTPVPYPWYEEQPSMEEAEEDIRDSAWKFFFAWANHYADGFSPLFPIEQRDTEGDRSIELLQYLDLTGWKPLDYQISSISGNPGDVERTVCCTARVETHEQADSRYVQVIFDVIKNGDGWYYLDNHNPRLSETGAANDPSLETFSLSPEGLVSNGLKFRHPEIAGALKPLNLVAEKQGIRMEAISALAKDKDLWLVYSVQDMTGKHHPLDLDVFPAQKLGLNIYGEATLLLVEEDRHRSTWCIHYTDEEPLPAGDPEIVISEKSVSIRRETGVSYAALAPLLEQYGVITHGVTPPELMASYLPAEGFAAPPDSVIPADLKILDYQHPLNIDLVPGDPVFEGIKLTGIGWIDGKLHVQIHNEKGREIDLGDGHCNSWFSMPYQALPKHISPLWNPIKWDTNGDNWEEWAEFVFEGTPESLKEYASLITLGAVEDVLKDTWSFSFPRSQILAD